MIDNGKITAPVRMRDVWRLLGDTARSLKELCLSANINIWSKRKPVPGDSISPLEEEDFAAVDYGIKVGAGDNTAGFAFDELINALDNAVREGKSISVTYNRPHAAFRLTDFNGYDHFAPAPKCPPPTIPESKRVMDIYTAEQGQEIAFPRDWQTVHDYFADHFTKDGNGVYVRKPSDNIEMLDFSGIASLLNLAGAQSILDRFLGDNPQDCDTEDDWNALGDRLEQFRPVIVHRACRFYRNNSSVGTWIYWRGADTDTDNYRHALKIDPLYIGTDGIIADSRYSSWHDIFTSGELRVIELLLVDDGGMSLAFPIPGLYYSIHWNYIETIIIPTTGEHYLHINDDTEYSEDDDGKYCLVAVDFAVSDGGRTGALDYYDTITVCIAEDTHGKSRLTQWPALDMKSLDADTDTDEAETSYLDLGDGDRQAWMFRRCTLETRSGYAYAVVDCTKDGKHGYLAKRLQVAKAVSCFGTGEWLNGKPWWNDDKWKYNK